MNSECRDFRTQLESELAGAPGQGDLRALGWHSHLHTCASCRTLFEGEEALEHLLAALPDPDLSPAVRARLLQRLRAVHGETQLDGLLDLVDVESPADLAPRMLDRLRAEAQGQSAAPTLDDWLEAAGVVSVPPDLARTILKGLASERRLEALLDEAGAVDIPVGLADRVLAAVDESARLSRGSAAHSNEARGPRSLLPRLASAPAWRVAAALALIALGALAWKNRGVQPDGTTVADGISPTSVQPDDEMLAALDVLENWDLLQEREDLSLIAFEEFEAGDEALLEWLSSDTDGTEDEDDDEG